MSDTPAVKALLFMKGHSARVPRKNMRPLCGRPLFHWILDELTACRFIEEIIINTDSDEIAQSASENYRVTIHMRPDHLLKLDRDEAYQLMAHDLSLTTGDLFLQTHSTTPLLKESTMSQALETFFAQKEHDSMFSVTPVRRRFYWSDGRPINHDPDMLIKTQDLPPVYEENSCLYIFSRSVFERKRNRIGYSPLMFPVPADQAVDIDDLLDFEVAESLMKARLEERAHPPFVP